MIGRVLCILIGIALALLAGAGVLVLFVYGPRELLEGDGGKATEAGLLALETVRHGAVLAAPLALIAAVVGVWRRWAGPTYYLVAGTGIAAIGYAAEQATAAAGETATAAAYALAAFLTAGFAAGLVYWLVAGRQAKVRQRQGAAARPPQRPAPGMPEGAA
jgi:hypothetical protein